MMNRKKWVLYIVIGTIGETGTFLFRNPVCYDNICTSIYIKKKKLKTTIPVGFTKLYCGFEVRNEIIETSLFQMLQCV